ncbi:GerMN domain-containing protein [Blastococcus sp. TF02A-26]|uniref:GerMN domain-containing protein n=1 Tax=Blastococcus sp. TF02A-26 TaxID=2250577 RepID=UPI00131434AE|nr:GerMN domain-containing protein [Blastococcus sp. TF02A-26]
MRRTARLLVAAGLAVLTGCGLPSGGDAETIPTSEVPYGLLSSPPTPPASSSEPQGAGTQVYLLGPDDVLVPSGREVTGTGVSDRLQDLLGHLAAGPTAEERAGGLTTVLAPGTGLTVTAVDGDTVTLDLTGPGEPPTGQESRLAVGQIVLTAATLPGVAAVLLTQDGEPLEAPLPTGELTTRPLTAPDYAALLVAPPP